MRLLLDTHVWLWSRLRPERLSPASRDLLVDQGNELWLSPISVWETLLLIDRGRLSVDAPAGAWVSAALRTVPMKECPLNNAVALASRAVQLEHRDPADRFIAASAIVYDLTLLTADVRLLAAPGLSTVRAD